jgi:2-succinyl-5-enolpyruvyl-6-hydroxy-3-cyclohexene-1-carboxylate synthase
VTRPRVQVAPAPALLDGLRAAVDGHPRGVIVAGRLERDPDVGEALAGLADALALPLLADPLSGARRGPAAVAHYDALLRDPGWAAAHAPDLVIRVGDLPTSKPLRRWLHGLDGALQIAFDAEAAWQDPAGAVATIVGADPRVLVPEKPRKERGWLEAWRTADRAAVAAIARLLGEAGGGVAGPAGGGPPGPVGGGAAGPAHAGLSEPRVAAELGVRLPPDATLVVASSMPVRDVETFFPAREQPPRVLSNRGANGIDGTVSTAFGVAAAGRPTVLLTGDVALAHDVGGLLAARRLDLPLAIVLLNNDGGGIFDFLPVASEGADFVRHVATPHGLDFAHAAALYGLGHELVDTPEAFRTALDRALGGTASIVEVRTDRGENVELHRRVWQAVVQSVRGAA